MKAALMRALLLVAGLALLGWGLLPAAAGPARAAPPMLVTETPTGEPLTPTPSPTPSPTSTSTSTSTPTPTQPTAFPTPTPPTASPTPGILDDTATPTPPPDDTPPPGDERRDKTPTADTTPIILPTADTTPIILPTADTTLTTPEPGGEPLPDPAIAKAVSPGAAGVGDSVEYVITVTNLGGSVATGVEVSDTLPAFVAPTGVTASRGEASLDGQTVRVAIGDLAPGETVTISVAATVVAPAPEGGNRNLAVVTSTSPDSNPDNNQASVPLDTLLPAALPSAGASGRERLPAAALLLGTALVAASLAMRRRRA